MKFLKVFLCSIFILTVFSVNSFALSAVTSNDVTSTSSTAQNLVNKAVNYDSFMNSDFVIFQSGTYDYYIVWGELTADAGYITGREVEYIHYFRTSSGTSYRYYYEYQTDTSFSLALDSEVVTNLEGVGFRSPQYMEVKYQYSTTWIIILTCAFCGAIMFLTFRGVFK